jgi:hypothetical protein
MKQFELYHKFKSLSDRYIQQTQIAVNNLAAPIQNDFARMLVDGYIEKSQVADAADAMMSQVIATNNELSQLQSEFMHELNRLTNESVYMMRCIAGPQEEIDPDDICLLIPIDEFRKSSVGFTEDDGIGYLSTTTHQSDIVFKFGAAEFPEWCTRVLWYPR